MNRIVEHGLADKFWKDGYIVLEHFFDDKLMEQYHELILSHYGDSPDFLHDKEFLEKSSTDVIPWFPQRDGVAMFDQVEKDQRLNQLTEIILGAGWYSDYSMVMYSGPGSQGQSWHQDCAPDNPQQFNLNRLVYTMDITAQLGGQTVVVPGSHLRGLLPAGSVATDFADKVILEPGKGTLVLLHGHTWHKVLPVHGEYRVSTNYRCAPKNTPREITDICVYQNMRYQFSTSSIVEERL